MGDFFVLFSMIFQFFRIPLTVYGFTFSFFDVFIVGCICTILIRFVVNVVKGGDD